MNDKRDSRDGKHHYQGEGIHQKADINLKISAGYPLKGNNLNTACIGGEL